MHITLADSAPDRNIYNIAGCTSDEMDNKLNLFFISQGYRLKNTDGELRTYEKGNRALRLLFGAFVKYHKQSVTIKHQQNLHSVLLVRDSTGMSGGLIGMNQVKKEFARLSEAFMAYFRN
jgi:hypothetical protein